jgi:hypothetical protein
MLQIHVYACAAKSTLILGEEERWTWTRDKSISSTTGFVQIKQPGDDALAIAQSRSKHSHRLLLLPAQQFHTVLIRWGGSEINSISRSSGTNGFGILCVTLATAASNLWFIEHPSQVTPSAL